MAKKRDGCDIGLNEDEDFPRLLPPVCEAEFAENQGTEEIKKRKINNTKGKTCKKQKVPKEVCNQHGRELNLYCFDRIFQKSICISCMHDHSRHYVRGVEEKEKVVTQELKRIKIHLEQKLISKADKFVVDKTNECVNDLKKTKQDFDSCFDKMIEEAESQGNQTKKQIRTAIRTCYDLVNNTIETLKSDGSDYDTARGITDKIKDNLSNGSSFKLPVFRVEGLSVEMVSDRVTTREISAVLPDCEDEEAEAMKLLPTRLNPSHFVCLGIFFDFSSRNFPEICFSFVKYL